MASTRGMHVTDGTAARTANAAESAQPEDATGRRPPPAECPLDFVEIYDQWFDEVSRWIRALGGPAAHLQDELARDVFTEVQRRLEDFDGRNLPSWLFQIVRKRVRDFRRLAAIRRILARLVRPVGDESQICAASPEESFRKREQRALERLLDQLSDLERSALVLFEVEGYSGEQIALIQNTTINTTWARIQKARMELRTKVAFSRGHAV